MKALTIANPASINSGAKSPAISSDGSPDTQFNQVLSREIADRRSIADAGKAAPQEKNTTGETSQATPSAASSGKADSADAGRDAAAGDGKTTPAATDTATTDGATGKAPADAADKDDTTADLAAASDELLALVANLNQIPVHQSAPTGRKQKADTATQVAAQIPAAHDTATVIPAIQPEAAAGSIRTTDPAGDRPAAVMPLKDMASRTPEFLPASKHAGTTKSALASNRNDIRETPEKLAVSGQSDAKLAKADTASTDFAATTQRSSAPAVQQAAPALSDTKSEPNLQIAVAPATIMTPAQIPMPQAIVGDATALLAPPVGSRAWDQALGQKIVWMVGDGQQSASLTLNPPDLGPLQVVLSVTNNHATANFTAAQPEVRQALETAMPKLREMLGDAGIQLGQANVSAGTPHHQQSAFGDQQRPSHHAAPASEASGATVRTSRSRPIASGQGLVDTFA